VRRPDVFECLVDLPNRLEGDGAETAADQLRASFGFMVAAMAWAKALAGLAGAGVQWLRRFG
jgi:hypothetical protein